MRGPYLSSSMMATIAGRRRKKCSRKSIPSSWQSPTTTSSTMSKAESCDGVCGSRVARRKRTTPSGDRRAREPREKLQVTGVNDVVTARDKDSLHRRKLISAARFEPADATGTSATTGVVTADQSRLKSSNSISNTRVELRGIFGGCPREP